MAEKKQIVPTEKLRSLLELFDREMNGFASVQSQARTAANRVITVMKEHGDALSQEVHLAADKIDRQLFMSTTRMKSLQMDRARFEADVSVFEQEIASENVFPQPSEALQESMKEAEGRLNKVLQDVNDVLQKPADFVGKQDVRDKIQKAREQFLVDLNGILKDALAGDPVVALYCLKTIQSQPTLERLSQAMERISENPFYSEGEMQQIAKLIDAEIQIRRANNEDLTVERRIVLLRNYVGVGPRGNPDIATYGQDAGRRLLEKHLADIEKQASKQTIDIADDKYYQGLVRVRDYLQRKQKTG